MKSTLSPEIESSGQEEKCRLLSGDDGSDAEQQPSTFASPKGRPKWFLHIAGLLPLALLLLGGSLHLASRIPAAKPGPREDFLWNGTHEFKRTVVLISIDGLRADYLDRGLTPHLLNISKQGIRAKYMKPVFPTLTFPNHWTLMTGLYAESHGIVANSFWNPISNTTFHYNKVENSRNPSWWLGEPMWETAERAGVKCANLMWPGPPITRSGASPTYYVPWKNKVPLEDKLDQILHWVDMDVEQRPELILAYEDSLDQAGHAWGPFSKAVNDSLRSVDIFGHSLHKEFLARNLSDIADIVFVSDHGMGDTNVVEWLFIDDESILGSAGEEEPTWDSVTHSDGWPSMGLRLQPGTDQREVLKKLMRAVRDERYAGKFDVFVAEAYSGSVEPEDGYDIAIPMPERYHYSANERIAPIWIIPRLGYALTTKQWGENGMSTGNHGYDNEEPAMYAIFVAHGPFSTGAKGVAPLALDSSPLPGKSNAWHSIDDGAHVIQGFANVEIYNLVMQLLGIVELAAPTNGTQGFWDAYLEV